MAMRFTHESHLRNSFPVAGEERHLHPDQEAIEMYAQPTVTLTAFSQQLQVVSAAWKQAVEQFRKRREAARQKGLIATLPAYLRHDIGELDCRPPLPQPLSETLKARQTTLESTWLSQF